MKTKEAIKFPEECQDENIDLCEEYYDTKLLEVIGLFKNGKKYKQIIEDVKQYIIDWRTVEENFATNGKDIIDLIDWLKRKYFPKPKKQCSDIELLEQIKNEFIKEEHSYYIERFMKVCIELFKKKRKEV